MLTSGEVRMHGADTPRVVLQHFPFTSDKNFTTERNDIALWICDCSEDEVSRYSGEVPARSWSR
jgi:hypothetical protein